ncbi:MAG: DUF1080 domain-containing protein [Prevotella sp.]|nr:DUF1080 domain-containing protein [Prevotella sp.]
MRKLIYNVVLVAAMTCISTTTFAQQRDARGRVLETIVADGLAQLPAKTTAQYEEVMGELANTGEKGMDMLISKLGPSAEGKNATYEYAINGVVNYVSQEANKSLREPVRKALLRGIESQQDKVNKAFLLSILPKIAQKSDAQMFAKYLNDPYQSGFARTALASMNGSEDVIRQLINEGKGSKADLAYLAYQKKLAGVEDALTGWINGADAKTKAEVFNALSAVGSSKSLSVLATAAKAAAYNDDATGATDSYLQLLNRLSATDSKAVQKAAKELMKDNKSAIRCAGLKLALQTAGGKAGKLVQNALKDNDIEYRNTALLLAEEVAGNGIFDTVGNQLSKLSPAAKVDVARWLGNNHVASQVGNVISQINSADKTLAESSIVATSKIGGEKALSSLLSLLGTDKAEAASAALLTYNGEIGSGLVATLAAENPTIQAQALGLVADRHVAAAYPQVVSLLKSPNADVKKAAYNALAGVARAENFGQLCDLLEKASGNEVAKVQAATLAAIQGKTAEEQLALVTPRLKETKNKALYYPLIAQVGTKEAISTLMEEYAKPATSDAALASLLTVQNSSVIDNLYEIAKQRPAQKNQILGRYYQLVDDYNYGNAREYRLISQALDLHPSTELTNNFINALSSVGTVPSLQLASQYLGNKETAVEAAKTVKTLVAKNKPLQFGEDTKEMLLKAQDIFRSEKAKGDADAGYAIDEIAGLLAKVQESNKAMNVELSKEEKDQGFELLFDGKTLDKWHGNKTNYVSDNGTIYVSAGYGDNGNLYTNKKYSDFVYRFEFAFLEPGVNNGIGIRTKDGVDAAYDGMEIQVLDHDASIYAGWLREYQQHGSVYGIIPSKRVVFPPLGTWNTEEIRAEGDHITVTVNGEVILDGNIREACQGHNMAPEGAKENPYTVDHQSHPGLFNKDGYISFCGHGEGVRFRNIRILDLSKQKPVAKKAAKKSKK